MKEEEEEKTTDKAEKKEEESTTTATNRITFPPDDRLAQLDRMRSHLPLNEYAMSELLQTDFPKPLSAGLSRRRTKMPKIFQYVNAYLGLDTMLFQDAYLTTITGSIIDFIAWLVIGKGIEPVLVLRHPEEHGDEKSQRKEIEKDEKILSKLREIDESVGESDTGLYDHSFDDKMKGLLKTTLCYGRGAFVKIHRGKSNHLIQLHPRDMVYNYVDPATMHLKSIQTVVAENAYFMDELIYAEYNPENPSYRNMFFGFSLQQRMLGSARTLKRIHDVDMQLFAQKRWAGSSIIAIAESEGKDTAATLTSRMKAGEVMSFSSNDPETAARVYDIPLPTDTGGLIDLSKYLVNYCLSIAGIPNALFFDETSAPYATLIGKMRAFLNGPIAEYRKWFGDIVARQWYRPNFEDVADDELLKKYTIGAKFSDIEFESPEEKGKLLETLNRLGFALRPEAAGEILGIENLDTMIDSSREPAKDQGFSIEKADGTKDTMRPLSAAAADDDDSNERGRWITVKGTHVFIPDGKDAGDAIREHFESRGERTPDEKPKAVTKSKLDLADSMRRHNIKINYDHAGFPESFSGNTYNFYQENQGWVKKNFKWNASSKEWELRSGKDNELYKVLGLIDAQKELGDSKLQSKSPEEVIGKDTVDLIGTMMRTNDGIKRAANTADSRRDAVYEVKDRIKNMLRKPNDVSDEIWDEMIGDTVDSNLDSYRTPQRNTTDVAVPDTDTTERNTFGKNRNYDRTTGQDTESPNVSFTQIREGAWGIRSDQELTIGDTVTVTKKSGKERSVIVDELVESGDGGYVYFVSDGGGRWIRSDQRDEIRNRVGA